MKVNKNTNINIHEIKDVINKSHSHEIYNNLFKTDITDKLKEANALLEELDDIKNRKKTYEVIEEREIFELIHEDEIKKIEYVITNGLNIDIFKDVREFKLLTHNFYSIRNKMLDLKTNAINDKIKNHETVLNDDIDKIKVLENKFEGIGSTAITMITSIGVITSSIAAIEKISSQYIPLFIISMIWMGMTFIVFINKVFSNKDDNSSEALFMYYMITVIWLITLGITFNIFKLI